MFILPYNIDLTFLRLLFISNILETFYFDFSQNLCFSLFKIRLDKVSSLGALECIFEAWCIAFEKSFHKKFWTEKSILVSFKFQNTFKAFHDFECFIIFVNFRGKEIFLVFDFRLYSHVVEKILDWCFWFWVYSASVAQEFMELRFVIRGLVLDLGQG